MRKKSLKLWLLAGVIGLTSCVENSFWVDENQGYVGEELQPAAGRNCVGPLCPGEAAEVYNKRVPPLNSLIVCRDKQCAPAEQSMSKEYIYNSLVQLIDNNLDATALLCEANPQAHVCTNPYITVPARVGVTPAYVFFDGAKIVDASSVKGKTAFNLSLGYNLSYNGQTPTVCKPDTAMFYVKSNNDVMLAGNGFKCDMTSVGTTTVRVLFNVDYIDLDYGYIGGYYSIGLSGPANGGGSGYGLIRLPKDAHPLHPALTAAGADCKPAVPTAQPAVQSGYPKVKSRAARSPQKSQLSQGAQQQSQPQIDGKGEKDVVDRVFENGRRREGGHPSRPMRAKAQQPAQSGNQAIPANLKQKRSLQNRVVDVQDTGPEFDEIYIDDLDEYIK